MEPSYMCSPTTSHQRSSFCNEITFTFLFTFISLMCQRSKFVMTQTSLQLHVGRPVPQYILATHIKFPNTYLKPISNSLIHTCNPYNVLQYKPKNHYQVRQYTPTTHNKFFNTHQQPILSSSIHTHNPYQVLQYISATHIKFPNTYPQPI